MGQYPGPKLVITKAVLRVIIDNDTGAIVRGEVTIEDAGSSMLDTMLEIASGKTLSNAELLGQNDFIPWKRRITL